MNKTTAALALLLMLSPACATSFRGSANISVSECNRRCTAIHARVGAFVYMGQYSTACVCEPRRAETGGARSTAGSPAGAVAGVWMQMQAADQQRR